MSAERLSNNNNLFDGMIWWIGQIADDSTWRDNTTSGKFQDADAIPGWGNRYKVRIMGVDDHGAEGPIPEDQLRWANIMYPVTAGGGQGSSRVTPNLRQGNIVFGWFLDGKDMQVPIIMGVLGNNSQTHLATSIGTEEEEGATNASGGSIAKSGHPNKQEVEKPTARKAKVPDTSLATGKPKTPNQSRECATPLPGTPVNQYGLPASLPLSGEQLADVETARSEANRLGLGGQSRTDSIISAVASGVRNRCGEASSPTSDSQPGAIIESADNPHRQDADGTKNNDKALECIVTAVQQEDVVGAATKRIKIEVENLTAKVDKLLGSRLQYIDAVSGPPSSADIQKEVKLTAGKVAKYQKMIMDKMGEYQNKKMNLELTTVVAAMPSAMRYLFGEQKFLNTENTTKQYNEITNSIAGQMEGILTQSLDINNLVAQADALAASGALWASSNSQSAVSGLLDLGGAGGSGGGAGGGGGSGSSDGSSGGGTDDTTQIGLRDGVPRVPICYAEDIIAQGIAVNKDRIAKIANDQHQNYNRFLEDVKSELEKTDQEMEDKAPDMSNIGKVTAISDEAPLAAYEPIGGTNYYTQIGVPCDLLGGGTGTGFKVDIKVPSGGWYDNGFATINQGGVGYTVNVANSGSTSGTGSTDGAATTGGSGSGIKVNYTISSGVITGITTNTAGSNYKDGDVLTIVNNAAGTPSTNATFTVNNVRGVIDRMSDGGIKINDPGSGYKMGNILVISQQGSGGDAAVMVTQVFDLGEKKATAGPVTPGDLAGAVGSWVPPTLPSKPPVNPLQRLGDMLQMMGGVQGSLTQALDFVNMAGNMFPFEPPPNTAVSDCYTLATGGQGVPETEQPTSSAIDKATAVVGDVASSVPDMSFAVPSLRDAVSLIPSGDLDLGDPLGAAQQQLAQRAIRAQSNLSAMRAATAARENAPGNRVGDRVTGSDLDEVIAEQNINNPNYERDRQAAIDSLDIQ